MNILPRDKRVRIIKCLVEGVGIRATARINEVSRTTVAKLAVDAGKVCAAFQDEALHDLPCRRIQVDENWTFVYAKEKNVAGAAKAPPNAGDVWTWTAICADTKLIPAWRVGDRSGETALDLMDDLRSRLAARVQLTTDGYKAYLEAVEGAFGGDVDYAMLVKVYGKREGDQQPDTRYSPPECVGAYKEAITGTPDPQHVSTSYAERQNLTMRMSLRRYTRLTNAFSKRFENHFYAVALYVMYYNFCRPHRSLGMLTPAMAAGVSNRFMEVNDIVDLMDAVAPKPNRPKTYRKRE